MQTLQSLTCLPRCCYSVWQRRTRHRAETARMEPPHQDAADHFNFRRLSRLVARWPSLSNTSLEWWCKRESNTLWCLYHYSMLFSTLFQITSLAFINWKTCCVGARCAGTFWDTPYVRQLRLPVGPRMCKVFFYLLQLKVAGLFSSKCIREKDKKKSCDANKSCAQV